MFKRSFLFAAMMCIFVQIGICGNKQMYGPAKTVLGDKYETVASKYDKILDFNEGYAVVQKNGLSGLIDIEGAECIPTKYNYLGSYRDGLIAMQENKDDKKGFINLKEKIIISPQYETVRDFYKGVCIVEVNADSAIAINKKGKFLWNLPDRVKPCGNFYNGWAMVRQGDLYSFISPEGELMKYQYKGASSFFFKTGYYELPFAVALVYSDSHDYWYLINNHGYELSKEAYQQVASVIKHSEPYILSTYTGDETDEMIESDIAEYAQKATGKEVAQLVYDDIFSNTTANYIIMDDSATPSLERKQKIQNTLEGILGVIVILAFIAMVIHMVLILKREKESKFSQISVQNSKAKRNAAGLPDQMSNDEAVRIANNLDSIYQSWPIDKERPEDHYPQTKQEVQRGMEAVQLAIDAMPTDQALIDKINAWGEQMNEYNKRIFTGNKVFIVLNVLALALFMYLAISDGGAQGWVLPIMLIFILGGYILSAYEPTFIALKKEMRRGGRGKSFLAIILGGLATSIATAKTYKTITTYEDGHKETSTDNSETWISLAIALIVSIILVMFTFVFAFYNYLRNYVLYK